MASVDTSFGYPIGIATPFSITGGTETQLVVPPFTYNSGVPVPSPAQAAGSPLYIQVPPDVSTGSTDWDGHPFKVRIAGKITTGTGGTSFVPKLYLGNAALSAATNIGLTGVATDDTTTASASTNFLLDTTLIWDSTSQQVNGYYYWQIANNTFGPVAKITQATSVAQSGLIFSATVEFGGSAVNTLNLTEFTISRS